MCKTPKRKHRKLLDIVWLSFFGDDTKQQKQMSVGLHQTKKLLHSKRNSQQNEKATYRMGESISNHIFDKGLISKNT